MLVFLSPLLLIAAAAVRLQDGGPALARQARIGKDGRHFQCLTFRSLAPGARDRLAELLQSDPRGRRDSRRDRDLRMSAHLTPVGRLLKQSGLDGLPQLLNVLRGDMSLVGPQPMVPDEIRSYGRYFAAYRSVRPGVTGLWRIIRRSGFNARRHRVAMDVLYVRRRNSWLNLRILAGTLSSLFLVREAV